MDMRTALISSVMALSGCASAPAARTPLIEPAAQPKLSRPATTRIEVVAPSSDFGSRCPPEMVLVEARVCVDRYEAVLDEVLPDGSSRPWSPHHSPGEAKVRAHAREGAIPQAHISGMAAERACGAAGKRLCTSSEWASACGGREHTAYPYGPSRREGVCNDDGRASHPVAEITRRFGLDPDRMWYEGMSHPGLNQLSDTLDPAGAHADCASDYGAHDMVGNLHEWIDDPEGTFRGGFFMDTKINGEGCHYATTAHGKDYRDYSTGFRCCRDPEPMG